MYMLQRERQLVGKLASQCISYIQFLAFLMSIFITDPLKKNFDMNIVKQKHFGRP